MGLGEKPEGLETYNLITQMVDGARNVNYFFNFQVSMVLKWWVYIDIRLYLHTNDAYEAPKRLFAEAALRPLSGWRLANII